MIPDLTMFIIKLLNNMVTNRLGGKVKLIKCKI